MTISKNIYLELTEEFNVGRQRAIISGGQAVVLHRLALMSKDGDWILREDEECLRHILLVLSKRGAVYRFGAPLDIRWMAAGWSAHLEFNCDGMRIRTDFVTRPPRLSARRLAAIWREQENNALPYLGVADLIETKKTNREKDYVVIGELARLSVGVEEKMQYSRSARELMELAEHYPENVVEAIKQRPALAAVADGLDALETALDAERRYLIHANEARLLRYLKAAELWRKSWPGLAPVMRQKPLLEAHEDMVKRAEDLLPTVVPGGLA